MKCTIVSDGSELSDVLKNESEPPISSLKRMILETIGELYSQGYDTFITNCEYGIPLWSSEIVAAMKLYNDIRLEIVIPYEEQTTNWTEEHRDRYYKIHEVSDSVYLSSTRYSENCYDMAEQYMIDNSNMMLLFDRSNSKQEAISYAMKRGVYVLRNSLT